MANYAHSICFFQTKLTLNYPNLSVSIKICFVSNKKNAEGVTYHRPGCEPRFNNTVLPFEPRRGDTFGLRLRVPPVPGS